MGPTGPVVFPGITVPFPTVGSSSGIVEAEPGLFVVPNSGAYSITFFLIGNITGTAFIAVEINSSYSIGEFSPPLAGGNIAGTLIVNLEAGDIISLVNASGEGMYLQSAGTAPSNVATISIIQIH